MQDVNLDSTKHLWIRSGSMTLLAGSNLRCNHRPQGIRHALSGRQRLRRYGAHGPLGAHEIKRQATGARRAHKASVKVFASSAAAAVPEKGEAQAYLCKRPCSCLQAAQMPLIWALVLVLGPCAEYMSQAGWSMHSQSAEDAVKHCSAVSCSHRPEECLPKPCLLLPAAGFTWGADMKNLAISVGLATAVWFIPPPAGVTSQASQGEGLWP